MLAAINRLIVRISSNAWLFVATTAVAFGSLRALTQIGAAFPAVSGGARPFDLQNTLTADQVLQQLAGYGAEARQLYFVFTAIDYVFPLAAALFLAGLGTFCLRHAFPHAYDTIARRNLLPLFLAAALFDWLENLAALTAILTYPGTSAYVAGAVVLAKRLKLAFVFGTQGLVLLLAVAAAVAWLRRRLRSRQGPADARHQ